VGMVEYMTKKDIVEKIERVSFENGLFITDFDFSFPTYFENLFQDINELLDLFSVTLIVPSRGKFIHVCIEDSPDELREDFFLTGKADKETYYNAKPELYIVLYFDFSDIPEKKKEVFSILRRYEREFEPLDVRHYVYEDLSDYLEVVFNIKDFSLDCFYMDLL
jgi:hypothetical protein